MTPTLQIISLTQRGQQLASRLQMALVNSGKSSHLVINPKPFADTLQHYFTQHHPLIFIGAIAIVVRTLAPVLSNKYQDPPVIVIDESGQFVIPILSGHEGGANQLAKQLADMLNAQWVQTSAKPYLHPIYSVGFGCEKNCPIDYLHTLLTQALEECQLELKQISSINSIDLKANEPALLHVAKLLHLPFKTWDSSCLRTVENQLSQHSDYVFKTVGVYGVAESAALIGAQSFTQEKAELVLTKIKNTKATCAIARSYFDNADINNKANVGSIK